MIAVEAAIIWISFRGGLRLYPQFGRVYQVCGRLAVEDGGARFNRTSLPSVMILPKDICIVSQYAPLEARIQSRQAVNHRNRIAQVLFRLAPFLSSNVHHRSNLEELELIRWNSVFGGRKDSECPVQYLLSVVQPILANVKRSEGIEYRSSVCRLAASLVLPKLKGEEKFGFSLPISPFGDQQHCREAAHQSAVFGPLNPNRPHSLERLSGPPYFPTLKPGRCNDMQGTQEYAIVWWVIFLQNADSSDREFFSFVELP